MGEVTGGRALSARLHQVVLALAGRVDDDALSAARELLALAEPDRAVDLIVGCLVAGGIPVEPAEADELGRLLDQTGRDAGWTEDLVVATAVPAPRHRFSGDSDPAAGLLTVLRDVVDGLPDVRAVHSVWRVTPAGSTPGPVPQRVVLVELGPGGYAPATAYRAERALRRAGLHAVVEVFASDAVLTEYHRAALAAAHPVLAPRPQHVAPEPEQAPDVDGRWRGSVLAEPTRFVAPVGSVEPAPSKAGATTPAGATAPAQPAPAHAAPVLAHTVPAEEEAPAAAPALQTAAGHPSARSAAPARPPASAQPAAAEAPAEFASPTVFVAPVAPPRPLAEPPPAPSETVITAAPSPAEVTAPLPVVRPEGPGPEPLLPTPAPDMTPPPAAGPAPVPDEPAESPLRAEQSGYYSIALPSWVENELNDTERKLLRQLHEELALRERQARRSSDRRLLDRSSDRRAASTSSLPGTARRVNGAHRLQYPPAAS